MHSKQLSTYSRKIAKNKNIMIISRQFDDGKESIIPSHDDSFEEYDIAGKGLEFNSTYSIQKGDEFVEYDIASRDFSDDRGHRVVKDLIFESEGYVEPFQDSVISIPKQKNTSLARSISLELPYTVSQQSKMSDRENSETLNSISDNKGKISNDEEFIADLKSILGGQMAYDPISGKLVNKAGLALQRSKIQTMAKSSKKEEKELKQIDQKNEQEINEHKIFDEIRRKMTYANAYDLGSVSIEKRFQEFDELMDLKEKNKKDKKFKSNQKEIIANDQPKWLPTAVSSQDFIEDLNSITQKGALMAQASTNPSGSETVGRSIGVEALQEGDIIISTTNNKNSKLIRATASPEISRSSIYVGNGMVIEADSEGVREGPLDNSIVNDTVAVVYRHINMTLENAQKITDFLKKASQSKDEFDYWSLVRMDPYQIINNYCSSLPVNKQEECSQQARNFRNGTDINNEFYCSKPFLNAFKAANLSISDTGPSWSTQQDVVRLNHNGTLLYVGHLKI